MKEGTMPTKIHTTGTTRGGVFALRTSARNIGRQLHRAQKDVVVNVLRKMADRAVCSSTDQKTEGSAIEDTTDVAN